MKKLIFFLSLFLLTLSPLCFADDISFAPVQVRTTDASSSSFPYQIQISSGTFLGGRVWIETGGAGAAGGASNAPEGQNYYVKNGGNNTLSGLSQSSAWGSLVYACASAIKPGDVINVLDGTLSETATSNLAVGVSLIGSGTAGIIKANWTSSGDPMESLLVLSSSNEGALGNQTISNLRFDGNALTGKSIIYVRGRSNVSIHDCSFVDFSDFGITFNGRADETDAAPTIYAVGNKFYNNAVSNCSLYSGTGRGALQIGGQDGMLIYNNVMSQTGRAAGSNGYVIKYYRLGYLKGVKIYNNTITKAPYDGTTFDFANELWNITGGCEIYNNTIIGNTDLNLLSRGVYSYSLDFHHNTVGSNTQQTQNETGIELEWSCDSVKIRNNIFQNMLIPFRTYSSNTAGLTKIFIYNNVITGVGKVGAAGTAINFEDFYGPVSGVYVLNNTLISNGASAVGDGVNVGSNTNNSNFFIRNNIIKDFGRSPVFGWMSTTNATIDVVSIENNDLFGNGNGNAALWSGITPTNVTTANNITTDPQLYPDFTVKETSPAIDAGLTLSGTTGVSSDYFDISRPRLKNYDIGAYERQNLSGITGLSGTGPYLDLGFGAGSGASASLIGVDGHGIITLASGSGPLGRNSIISIRFGSGTYSASPAVVFCASNSAASGLGAYNFTIPSISSGPRNFMIISNTNPLLQRIEYKWNYINIG